MARVTVEDCLEKVPNRFALTVLSSRRARALSEGKGTALVKSNNKVGVVALREVAKGAVRYEEEVDGTIRDFIEEQRASLIANSGVENTFIDAATFGTGDDDDDDDDTDVKELSADPDKLLDDDDDDDDDDSSDSTTPAVTADASGGGSGGDSIDADDVDPAVLDNLEDGGDDDDDDD